MRMSILLLPAVFLSGALLLAAVAEHAAPSAHAKNSDCPQIQCPSKVNHVDLSPNRLGSTQVGP